MTAHTDAQERNETYRARLAPLGVTGATVNIITGLGEVTARLKGTELSIQGKFAGLSGAATEATVRRGPKGIPGPVIATLEVTRSSQGEIHGRLTLTPELIDDLRAGRLYVQIHSEKAPEGSIRGWLLK